MTVKTPQVGEVLNLDGQKVVVIGKACVPPYVGMPASQANYYEGWRTFSHQHTSGYHVQNLETGALSTIRPGKYDSDGKWVI